MEISDVFPSSSKQNEMSINDENNNVKNLLCSSCEGKTREREKVKRERGDNHYINEHSSFFFFKDNPTMMIMESENSSDEEFSDSSSTSHDNGRELVPIDRVKLWNDISHLIKCIYRENHREFIGWYL